MNEPGEKFYTARGYAVLSAEEDELTSSMEDYLEMIYRLSAQEGYTRVKDVADSLHVQPPSVTKMLHKLHEKGQVRYEKYGLIRLTPEGRRIGAYLLNRHNTLREFLQLIGVKEHLHEDVEGIEHNVSTPTLRCLLDFVAFLRSKPQIIEEFRHCQAKKIERGN
ncbi:MAG: transcriptional regulator MntR [Bacillota bacterium]